MPIIAYQGNQYASLVDETVLDCLQRHGCDVSFSCKAGACQSCLMQARAGAPPATAQAGLKPGLKQQGYFLSCQWRPENDISVITGGRDTASMPATISRVSDLNHNTKRVQLVAAVPLNCTPGQYISLINGYNVTRSYSIANRPDQDGYIELHIRHVPNGKMSGWIHAEAQSGDAVHIRGPIGSCCYTREEQRDFPMLLSGTGTGLAPLLGIIRDALAHKHRGPIMLVQGALRAKDLYYVDMLRALENDNEQFSYLPCVRDYKGTSGLREGDIEDITLGQLPKATDPHVYLCGAPEFVNGVKRKIFLAGVALANIYTDAFLPSRA